MGTQSKTKANKTGVASSTREVLGASRGNSKGNTSSTRGAAKAFTTARAGKQGKAKSKAKSKVKTKSINDLRGLLKVYENQENVAEPDYYPKGMLSFCGMHLDSLEMDILKRLVRLHQKDTAGDTKKILHVLEYYFPKDRTPEQVYELVNDWATLTAHHDAEPRRLDIPDWDVYYRTRVPYVAHKFIRAVCLKSQDKLDLIQHEIKELELQFTQFI